MKLYKVFTLIFGIILISCSSGNDGMMDMNNGSSFTDEDSSLLKGDFVSDAHTTTGKVAVNKEETILSFQNFKTDSGPKLLVYLTPEVNSSDYINLGELINTDGSFTYIIPSGTDLSKYKKVVIWCIDFSVSFGHAELK